MHCYGNIEPFLRIFIRKRNKDTVYTTFTNNFKTNYWDLFQNELLETLGTGRENISMVFNGSLFETN